MQVLQHWDIGKHRQDQEKFLIAQEGRDGKD